MSTVKLLGICQRYIHMILLKHGWLSTRSVGRFELTAEYVWGQRDGRLRIEPTAASLRAVRPPYRRFVESGHRG